MLTELKQLFPSLEVAARPSCDEKHLSFPYLNKWLILPRASLSEKETQLMRLLLECPHDRAASQAGPDPWTSYLSGLTDVLPGQNDVRRVLHFYLQPKETDFDLELWKEAVMNLFSAVEQVVFLHPNEAAVIQQSPERLSLEETTGRMATLDDDFSLRTQLFIGQPRTLDRAFRTLFEEERLLFLTEKDRHPLKIMNLSTMALRYFTAHSIQKSHLIREQKERLLEDPEWAPLILQLWRTQGNISLAAKQLYIHRNTLQYRMDRFEESTGLSLRDVYDLTLCYLSLL